MAPTETVPHPGTPDYEPHPGARPWGPNGEPVDPPADGDDQARCWNLLIDNATGTGTQCVLFNGHASGHLHGLPGSELADAELRMADPRRMPWFAFQKLRDTGLLEGDAFDERWDKIVRDSELGKRLIDRYGVVLGQDADRLYMRRVGRGSS